MVTLHLEEIRSFFYDIIKCLLQAFFLKKGEKKALTPASSPFDVNQFLTFFMHP
jgi:hypothetical protein